MCCSDKKWRVRYTGADGKEGKTSCVETEAMAKEVASSLLNRVNDPVKKAAPYPVHNCQC